MDKPVSIAHISDLHFSKTSLNFRQFFSKRWLGNLNLLLRRGKHFHPPLLDTLIEELQKDKVDYVLISGDVSTTSKAEEFQEAKTFVNKLASLGYDVLTLPGNHDQYTRYDYKNQTFYEFFPHSFSQTEDQFSHLNLKEHKIAVKKLNPHWSIILLDTAVATSLTSSSGEFLPSLEKTLEELLAQIPKDHHLIIANHFPLLSEDKPNRLLERREPLKHLIQKHSNIKLYLHGHSHYFSLIDLRDHHLPILIDSGSTAHRKHGSFAMIDLYKNRFVVKEFRVTPSLHWEQVGIHEFLVKS